MAATITSTFRLDSLTGTDPLSIAINPSFTIGDPTGSGSITTVASPATDYGVLSGSITADTYVFIRNTGSSTSGNIIVTDGLTPNNIALLKPQDFCFFPLKGSTGLRLKYDTASTTVDFFYWTRA